MTTTSLLLLRDCDMCVFVFCLNGLRQSSVTSVKTDRVSLDSQSISVRLSAVKVQFASRAPLVSYSRFSGLPSPVKLWLRWRYARGNILSSMLSVAKARMLQPGGVLALYQMHWRHSPSVRHQVAKSRRTLSESVRIRSTEQVLLGFPLDVRLARFGWVPTALRWHQSTLTAQSGSGLRRSGCSGPLLQPRHPLPAFVSRHARNLPFTFLSHL